jgi:hypothetical protein
MTSTTFRRYTNLAAAIHLLQKRKITLLDPTTWDDRNDAYFMSEYKRRANLASVLALCFAEKNETYHHWRVFSHGSDGVCIEFDKEGLLGAFNHDGSVRHGVMKYILLKQANRMADFDIEQLPFLKRWPYGDEAEYRAVYVDRNFPKPFHDVPISLGHIKSITLSPWLPAPLAESVKGTLKAIYGCSRIRIHQSTLIENPDWKKLAGRAAPVVPDNP